MFDESFPAIYADLLRSLYKDLTIWPPEGLCAFAALTGRHWKLGDVVFYGRALNGWVPSLKFQWEDIASSEVIHKKAREICEAGHKTSVCKLDERVLEPPCENCDDPQLHWVHHPRNRKFYGRATVETTPFWSVIGTVLRKLELDAGETRWASWAAWSNLYKVAPVCGGNPGNPLMKCQLDACLKLLKAELTKWKPRAAVFLTEARKRPGNFDSLDPNGWFEPFRKELNVAVSPFQQNGHVLTGWTELAEQRIRIVVALRPENLERDGLSQQIVDAIPKRPTAD